MSKEGLSQKVLPKPLPVSTPDPMDRQRMMQTYKREREDDDNPDDPDGAWKPNALWNQQNNRGRRPTRSRGGRTNNQVKRFRADQEQIRQQQQAAIQAIQQQPKERPDANHHLKFTYGRNTLSLSDWRLKEEKERRLISNYLLLKYYANFMVFTFQESMLGNIGLSEKMLSWRNLELKENTRSLLRQTF